MIKKGYDYFYGIMMMMILNIIIIILYIIITIIIIIIIILTFLTHLWYYVNAYIYFVNTVHPELYFFANSCCLTIFCNFLKR